MKPVAYHLQATFLPDGTAPRDLWVVDGRISYAPAASAETLAPAGGYVLPGLVDCHAHLTLDFGRTGLERGSAALVQANRAGNLAAGVLLLRDIGSVSNMTLHLPADDGLPRVQGAGRYLAPRGGYGGMQRETEAADLPDTAAGQIAAGYRWVKVIADWPRVESGGAIPALHRGEVNYPATALRAATTAAHAAGARVAVHAMSREGVTAAVEAGVDCIEHATGIDGDLVERMAAARIAWTPTIAAFRATIASAERRGQEDVAGWLRECLAHLRELLPRARRLGIPILAGTDVLPAGAVAREVAALQAAGLTPVDALAAASTAARAYLGEPALEDGAPADLVLYPADPRNDPEILAHPALVMLGGVVSARTDG